jgi:hypothetical protein
VEELVKGSREPPVANNVRAVAILRNREDLRAETNRTLVRIE